MNIDALPKEERGPVLKAKLARMEAIIREKTNATLARNPLVDNFKRKKEDLQVQHWKRLQDFEKQQVATTKHEVIEMKKENKILASEIARMKRAVAQQRRFADK